MAMHHCLKQFLPTHKFTLNAAYVFIKALVVVSVCLSNLSALAQKYPASAIPDSLKENADVVIRLEEQYYEIRSVVKVISHERHVYTILNEKGERFATYKTRYNNKSISINSVNGYFV